MSPSRKYALSSSAASILALCLAVAPVTEASALEMLERTYLLNVVQGTKLSDKAFELSRGGYELSDGTYVGFGRWYRQNWRDMRFDFMTQLHDNFGLVWGLSTGESSVKYRIDPGLKIGFIMQMQPTPVSNLSFTITTILGGRLKEKPCVADYGEIGGVQQVNCRLAATELEPSETLKYSINMRPPDHSWVGLRYQLRF